MSHIWSILVTFVYIQVFIITHQMCTDFVFANANPNGAIGYSSHSNKNNIEIKPMRMLKRNKNHLKKFMQFFITESTDLISENATQISGNLPFMDFTHLPLIKRVIPNSEQVCSSVQLMSFWKLYIDIIDQVESEVFPHIDVDSTQNKTDIIHSHESDEVASQSMEIEKDVSEEIEAVKNNNNILLPVNYTSLTHQEKTALGSKNVFKTKKTNKSKKKKPKTGRNLLTKFGTFEFGLNRYYDLE